MEREVAEAERAVKKRKANKAPAEAPAVEDAKPEEPEAIDLLTESEGEGWRHIHGLSTHISHMYLFTLIVLSKQYFRN